MSAANKSGGHKAAPRGGGTCRRGPFDIVRPRAARQDGYGDGAMRWSRLFVPTLRDAPADAEAASHKLLVRGGFIRQLHAGHYSLLPLGLRVHDKVENIVRRGMEEIGRAGVPAAGHAPGFDLAALGALGVNGPRDVPSAGPQGGRPGLGHDPRGGVLRDRPGDHLLPVAASDLVPDPVEVPRRAPTQVGSAASAGVRNEGQLLLRSRRRGAWTTTSTSTGRPTPASSNGCLWMRSQFKPHRA